MFDFRHGISCDALEVAVESGSGGDDGGELLFTFGPEASHRLALAIEIVLHLGEFFDDGLYAQPEPGAGEVLVHQFHFAALTIVDLAKGGDLDQGVSQCCSEGHSVAPVRDPDAVDDAEGLEAFGQDVGDQQRDVGLRGALIVAQFGEPALIPGFGGLEFPK